MANEQSQNERGEYQIDEITYAKGGLLLMVGVANFELWNLNFKQVKFGLW